MERLRIGITAFYFCFSVYERAEQEQHQRVNRLIKSGKICQREGHSKCENSQQYRKKQRFFAMFEYAPQEYDSTDNEHDCAQKLRNADIAHVQAVIAQATANPAAEAQAAQQAAAAAAQAQAAAAQAAAQAAESVQKEMEAILKERGIV